MELTALDRLFWALSFFGHCVLLTVLLVWRRAGVLPVFTSLISFNILRTIVLYFTLQYGSSDRYFYTYWMLGIVDVGLQLAIVYELATHVFQPLGAWAPDVRRSFLTMAGASILIAFVLTWLAAPPTQTPRLAIVIRANFFASALLAELLVAMVALSVTLGLPWRTHAARIAQGFGVYSFTGILTDAAHSYMGSDQGKGTYELLSLFQIGIYLLCLMYWVVTLALKEPEPRKMPAEMHLELLALQGRAATVLRSIRTMGSAS